LYRDAQIKVKTGAAMTAVEATGENVAQGSIGGAFLSSCKQLPITSLAEMSWATRIQPLMFQDDTTRLVTSIEVAQKGNIIMNAAIKRKQLEINVDKCCVVVFDKKSRSKETRKAINQNSLLSLDGNRVKAKEQDKYLGDILNEGGLKQSVEATISERYWKAFASIR
jgi:hypothetical protein